MISPSTTNEDDETDIEVATFVNVTGSAHDDHLTGDMVDNHLAGGGGDDSLRGAAGADVLAGGPGADVLDGGEDTGERNNMVAGYQRRWCIDDQTWSRLPKTGQPTGAPRQVQMVQVLP